MRPAAYRVTTLVVGRNNEVSERYEDFHSKHPAMRAAREIVDRFDPHYLNRVGSLWQDGFVRIWENRCIKAVVIVEQRETHDTYKPIGE